MISSGIHQPVRSLGRGNFKQMLTPLSKRMRSKLESLLEIARHLFRGAVCGGAVLLISLNAPAQNLFEADYGSGQILEFTPGGTQSAFASGLNQPLGLAFDSTGNLYEADANSGNLYKFTPGGAQSLFASGLGRPNALAFDQTGNLFVTDGVRGDVYSFTPGGAQSTFASGLSQPLGLAFDFAGN